MPNETTRFENGPLSYRIQFEIVAPPPSPPVKPGTFQKHVSVAQFKVPSIRITEITEGVGDSGQKLLVNFGRGYDSVAQARTGANEYAKRMVREKMTPKPAAAATTESGTDQ
jgi:hypothetical protein